jgi:hypothetical protein
MRLLSKCVEEKKETTGKAMGSDWVLPLAGILGLAVVAACKDKNEEEVAKAARAYVYGLPIVLNYGTLSEYFVDKNSPEYKHVGPNEFRHEMRVYSYRDKSFVAPNADTPYSMALLDLRNGPVVVSAPEVADGRYYSIQFCDMNTYNVGYVGSRSTGNGAGSYAVAMKGQTSKMPKNVRKTYYSTTPFAIAIARIQLFGKNDMHNVVAIQEGIRIDSPRGSSEDYPPFAIVSSKMAKTSMFWDVLNDALKYIPITRWNSDIRREIAELGIGPQKGDAPRSFALEEGRILGENMVVERAKEFDSVVNGWRIVEGGGDAKRYSGNWLDRAAIADFGIYANDTEEAVYPFTFADSKGRLLDGRKHEYVIEFDASSMPPAKAFWSITAYDAKTKLLVQNAIDRNLVDSNMVGDMKRDGNKIRIYLQTASPGKSLENNWLPIPSGPTYLIMRIYWPEKEGSSILPPGHGSWKPPAVARVESRIS